ncbi:hypothetical protein C8R47DRAFT_1206057 [Mycena vitilis]|nr:hypothetical protein C8R47DRAFT_1206057 [Mycena vitilis]
MSDPIAAKSSLMKTYLSSDPDAAVVYAQWYGKVSEPIASAEMSAIDSKSMTLTCNLKNGSKKDVVVAIKPPFADYEDVKPRLLEMKAISQEGLGMIKPPQITSFHLPPSGFAIATFFIIILPYGAFAPSTGDSQLLLPAQFLRSYISQTAFKYLWPTFLALHGSESLYTLRLCLRHKASFWDTAAYVATTAYVGFPVWMDLRKRIRDARIRSAAKVE